MLVLLVSSTSSLWLYDVRGGRNDRKVVYVEWNVVRDVMEERRSGHLLLLGGGWNMHGIRVFRGGAASLASLIENLCLSHPHGNVAAASNTKHENHNDGISSLNTSNSSIIFFHDYHRFCEEQHQQSSFSLITRTFGTKHHNRYPPADGVILLIFIFYYHQVWIHRMSQQVL